MEDRKKKEKKKIYVAIVATVSLGTIATVQNFKKKRQSSSTKWHRRCTV